MFISIMYFFSTENNYRFDSVGNKTPPNTPVQVNNIITSLLNVNFNYTPVRSILTVVHRQANQF